jgi:hypothetical protein
MQLLNKRKLLDRPFPVALNILKHNGITSAFSEMTVTKVPATEVFLSLAIKMSCYTHSFFLQAALVRYICGTFTPLLVCFKQTCRYCSAKYHMYSSMLEYQLLMYWLQDVSLKTDAGRWL